MLSELVDKLTRYIQLKAELIKLQLMARMAKVLSQLIVIGLVLLFGFFLLFFLSFALGSFLNKVLESPFLGHLIVAGGYLLSLIILLLLVRSGNIQSWIESGIVKMEEQQTEDEND